MLSLRIASRFLAKSPLQSVMIALGIAVGIAVQVFVGSLITSLQANLLEQTVGSSPHITVTSKDQGDPVTFSDDLVRAFDAEPQVTTVVPVRAVSTLYTDGAESFPLGLQGGELSELSELYHLRQRVVAGEASLGSREVMVGKEFASKHGLGPGDDVSVRLPDGGRVSLKISGVFDLENATFNERNAFINGSFARQTLGLGSTEYTEILLQLEDPFTSADVAERWRNQRVFSDLDVTDWQAQNQALLSGLQSQSSSSYMIQIFVLIAVALGIASTLAVSAVQKTRQIGILKAMGMGDRGSAAIFLWQAAILGVAGTAVGIVIGLGLISLFQASAIFPIDPQPGFIAVSAGVGVSVALLSAIIPYRRTTRVDPIEVIQNA